MSYVYIAERGSQIESDEMLFVSSVASQARRAKLSSWVDLFFRSLFLASYCTKGMNWDDMNDKLG